MGQEFLEDKLWLEDPSAAGNLIRWDGLNQDDAMGWQPRCTRDLIALRKSQPALRGDAVHAFCTDNYTRVLAFHRWLEGSGQDVIVVATLSESTIYKYPIEAVDVSGPLGLPTISVCHYGVQNGDAMRDPEMCFEVGNVGGAYLIPFTWRNDYVGVEQVSRGIIKGHYVALLPLQEQHEKFAAMWDSNLHSQGFLEAFTDGCILG